MSKEQPTIKKEKSPLVKTLKWVGVATISVLLVLYFVFSSVSEGSNSILVGKVDGKPVYYSKGSAYANNYERMSQSMNLNSFDEATRRLFAEILEYQAFTTTANEMLMYNLAKKNIEVSDEYLVDNVKMYFVSDNGMFDEEQYRAFLASKNAVEKKVIEQDLRENIAVQTLAHELFQTAKTSSNLVEAEFAKRNNKRSVEVLYADAMSTFRDYVPTEAQMAMYFSENTENFMLADISWIACSSSSEATLLYDTLKNDMTLFEQMAREKSQDTHTGANGGRVGKLTTHEMPSAMIAQSVFGATEENMLLAPIHFEGYYYVILVHTIEMPSDVSQIEADIILNEYMSHHSDDILMMMKADLKTGLEIASSTTDDLSANSHYSYYAISDYNYGSTATDAITAMSIPFTTQRAFSDAVFGTAVGSKSSVIELPDGVAIVHVVSESKAPMVAASDATQEEIFRIEQERYEAAKEVYSQKANNLAKYWADKALANAKIEYKLKK